MDKMQNTCKLIINFLCNKIDLLYFSTNMLA